MDFETFQKLTASEVAEKMHRAGSTVCVFPINGTRRWFLLEHPDAAELDYMGAAIQKHVELYQLLFDHGIDTLLAPIFESVMQKRGEEYGQKYIQRGLGLVATHQVFTDFYRDYQVRVRFYGDYRRFFSQTDDADILSDFDHIVAKTQTYQPRRLFYGVCTRQAIETAMELAIQHYLTNGQVPDRQTLIKMYYGEPIPPVSLFLTSGKFNAFGMPLLETDDTSLYFTVAPSPYLTERQLRTILYDHLYERRHSAKPDYSDLTADEFGMMRTFYRTHLETTLGMGTTRNGIWYPSISGEINK